MMIDESFFSFIYMAASRRVFHFAPRRYKLFSENPNTFRFSRVSVCLFSLFLRLSQPGGIVFSRSGINL